MTIHKEGYRIIIINFFIWAIVSTLFFIFSENDILKWVMFVVSVYMALFMFRFFRVPNRDCVLGDNLVISPGDGKVVAVKEVDEPEFFKGKCLRISVFLTFFNVHVTWSPVSGNISYYKYHPGKYLFAWYPKSSDKNERTTIGVHTDAGHDIMFRQIAGIVARRIVCYAKEGERFEQTQQAGFIKFGSRLDVFLPLGTEVLVKKGDKVRGQESVLAKL